MKALHLLWIIPLVFVIALYAGIRIGFAFSDGINYVTMDAFQKCGQKLIETRQLCGINATGEQKNLLCGEGMEFRQVQCSCAQQTTHPCMALCYSCEVPS